MNTASSTQPPLADGPLNGVRVIDLTRVLAGPYCTMVLADLGADVIKVENPNGGDDARAFGPFIGERSAYFASLNRGKQSIALNLKEEADKAVFHDLLAGADVLVENYRPGTMEKLGLGWEDLHTRYPKLIYAAASGFGHTGPYKTRAAYDMVVQAMGGIMSVTGYPGQPPVRVGSSIGDITAGLFTAVGVNAALLHRATSGQTMKIDVSMLDCQVAILENAIARYAATGEVAGPIGARHPAITPFAAFQAADGWIVIAAGNDSLFAKLCDAIGRPDLITDPRFTTNGARTGNADALTVELNNALAAKPAADWLSTLDAVGVPSGPINKIDQVLNDVQVRARNMVVTAPDPDLGELLMAGNPIKLSPFTDPATRHPAPALDADRAAILSRVRATDEAPATGGESAAEISPPVARMPAATTSAAVQATAAYLDQVGSFFSRLTDFRAALTSRNDSFEEKAIKLCDALLSERGEVLGTAVAVDLVTLIRAASQAERRQFIDLLADRYAPDQRALATAVDDYRLAPTASNLAALSEAVEAPRQQLFRRANTAPLGTRMLLDLRTEILAGKRDNPGWTPVDDDLRHLFGSWFNRGFLQLRRIDWNTPAAILEKLIDYEAVHTIAGWDDLRRRLASDRRCFAFFHPALPDEPLIFVEIALVNELSDSITPILTAPSPTDKGQGSAPDNGRKIAANTAIFYSISNCQPGLRGIAFGNLLIKQVVSELAAELPGLKTFATLSPIPRLRRHVEQYAQAELREIIGEQLSDEALAATGATSLADALSQLAHECAEAAAAGDPAASDPAHETLAQNILLPLTARYLTGELPGQDGPTDPVGRFHLGNGAAIARVNFAGDVSTKGLAESYGMMVNYQYDLDNIANHHEAFANNQPVARLRAVTDLMGGRDNGLLSGAADLFRSTRS